MSQITPAAPLWIIKDGHLEYNGLNAPRRSVPNHWESISLESDKVVVARQVERVVSDIFKNPPSDGLCNFAKQPHKAGYQISTKIITYLSPAPILPVVTLGGQIGFILGDMSVENLTFDRHQTLIIRDNSGQLQVHPVIVNALKISQDVAKRVVELYGSSSLEGVRLPLAFGSYEGKNVVIEERCYQRLEKVVAWHNYTTLQVRYLRPLLSIIKGLFGTLKILHEKHASHNNIHSCNVFYHRNGDEHYGYLSGWTLLNRKPHSATNMSPPEDLLDGQKMQAIYPGRDIWALSMVILKMLSKIFNFKSIDTIESKFNSIWHSKMITGNDILPDNLGFPENVYTAMYRLDIKKCLDIRIREGLIIITKWINSLNEKINNRCFDINKKNAYCGIVSLLASILSSQSHQRPNALHIYNEIERIEAQYLESRNMDRLTIDTGRL